MRISRLLDVGLKEFCCIEYIFYMYRNQYFHTLSLKIAWAQQIYTNMVFLGATFNFTFSYMRKV
jgi:hypothetical protein